MYRSRNITRMLWQQSKQLKLDNARPCIHILFTQYQRMNTREQGTIALQDSYVKKFMKAVGWMDQHKTRLKLTGYFLYESIPEKVAYIDWFNKLELPDTFTSWFTVTELHIWLLMVRYMAEDLTVISEKKKYVNGDGQYVRNCIIEALWADVANRIKLLEGANPAIARKQVAELSEQFLASLVAYDEGLNDDKVLASAIWRRFFLLSDDVKPEHVESVIFFIRHQLVELDKIKSDDLIRKPEIPWLSIKDH